ncbi:hypothetical protein [Cytobacillus massiliigabonensis]|uniref:hypothetical protein n=1 Tax=Cytobacillus massiliigabonensis TaxID=1871011 RepID=UPI0015E12D55|nr:hypothetical protein [Cytobacillus massiliigabonensis]
MFNRKIAALLCGLGIVTMTVEQASIEQIASYITIIAGSFLLLRQQEKKLNN